MGRAYSLDLRERVVAAVERDGLSRREAAERFGIGISSAIRWVERVRRTGSAAPGQMGGYKPKAIAGSTGPGFLCGSRKATSPSGGWWWNSPNAASRSITERCGTLFTPRS